MRPIKYVRSKFEHGSVNASVFSLIHTIIGAGLLTFPYAFMQNGLIFALLLVVFSSTVSWYTGMLLVHASEASTKSKYEDIAYVLYGRRFSVATTVLILIALLGNTISYTVYVI